MHRTLLVAFVACLPFGGTLARLSGQVPAQSVEQQLRSQFRVASLDSNARVVRAGSVLVVAQDGLKADPPSPAGCWYNSHKPGERIKYSTMFEITVPADLKNQVRLLQVGEKVVVLRMDINRAEVGFCVQTYSDNPNDPPYRAAVAFQFQQKNFVQPANLKAIQDSIAEVFSPDTATPTERSVPTVQLEQVAGRYVFANAPNTQMQLNADGTLSLVQGGQTFAGTFTMQGNRIIFKIGTNGKLQELILQGDGFLDPKNMRWVKQTDDPAVAAHGIEKLHLPSTYVNGQSPADQIQLNADNSFTLQEAGQSYQGTFIASGNTVELNISGGTKTTAIIQGNDLTDSGGQKWVLREQSAGAAPSGSLLQNETSQAQPKLAETQSTMTVDDVIKMVQVKLADDLIIAQIRKNGKPFSLSADELVRLKTTGASDNVIRAMIDPQASDISPASRSTAAVSMASSSPPLPSAYGYYIYDGRKLSELGSVPVLTKFGLTAGGDRGFAVDGLSDQAPLLRVDSQSPTIIVYQQNVQPSALQLSSMFFVRTLKAYQFNVLNTAPQFFANIYKKDPNETIPIDLWRPSRDVQMRIEPVEGKAGMYRLVPAVQLEVGKYVLYFPDSLHANDIVFSASVGRQSAVLGFEVVRSNSPSPAGGDGAPPRRTGGALYVARPDGKMTVVRTTETAMLRYAFGAKKTVDLSGGMSSTRVNLHDNEIFLVSTPSMGWGRTGEYKVYVFEVKNGKRTSVINKTGLTFSVEPYGSAGEFVKLRIAGELVPGEYAFGPSNPTVPNNGGGGPMPVITFGVD